MTLSLVVKKLELEIDFRKVQIPVSVSAWSNNAIHNSSTICVEFGIQLENMVHTTKATKH